MVLAFSVGPTNCVALFLCAKCHSKKRNNTVVKNGIVENSCQEGLLPAVPQGRRRPEGQMFSCPSTSQVFE